MFAILRLNISIGLWALSSMDIGKIKSVTPIQITTDNTLPLPTIYQSFRLSVLAGLKPIIQDYFKRELIIPCMSPYNSPTLLVKKPNGKDRRFV